MNRTRQIGPRQLGRAALLATALAAATLLGGCAALNSVASDVSSYGQWPAGRKPGSYAFERLPSQQANPQEQAALEQAASGALAKAGFRPAADGARADVSVQVSARLTRVNYGYDYPAWNLGFGLGYGSWGRHWGSGIGVGFGFPYDRDRYEREVALLIRDRASGQALYETRASSDGYTSGDARTLAAMFDAALLDFPTPAVSPRRVRIPLGDDAAKATDKAADKAPDKAPDKPSPVAAEPRSAPR